jgi:uroporphyrinogen III methyltransferase/synthase
MTLHGRELLSKAGVVIFDRLVGKGILSMIPRSAKKIDAGKSGEHHQLEQDEINRLMARLADSGKIVVRLKGGDPFLFGRGAEEAEFLAEHDIPFEIVPGVSSATAVPTVAGIPVTHRDIASAVTIVTGHESEGGLKVDWAKLAKIESTIVVLMGARNLSTISRKLVRAGRPASTPVALIEKGTHQDQVTIVGTLRDISRKAARANINPPVIIVIGNVVRLRKRLKVLR